MGDSTLVFGAALTILSALIITLLAVTSIRKIDHIEKREYTNLREIIKDDRS